MLTKFSIISVFASLALSGAVLAENDQIRLSPADNTLLVSGECASAEVLIVVKKAGADDIWGSSNPPCSNGHYSFTQKLGEWRLTEKDLDVSVVDGGYDAYKKNKLSAEAIPRQRIHIPEPAAPEEAPPASAADGSLIRTAAGAVDPAVDAPRQTEGMLDAMVGAAKHVMTLIADTIRASVLQAVQLIAQAIRVEYGGDITVPSGENQIAGNGRITRGATEVFVANTQVTDSAKIMVTPAAATDIPLSVSEKNAGAGFRVVLPRPAEKDIPFDWLIIKTYGQNAAPASPPVALSASPLPSIAPPLPTPATLTSTPSSSTTPKFHPPVADVAVPVAPEARSPPVTAHGSSTIPAD